MKRLLIALTLACVLSGTALAGEMPTVNPVVGEMPSVDSKSTGETSSPPIPGEMPGVGSVTSSGTDTSLVTTVLLTIITALTGH